MNDEQSAQAAEESGVKQEVADTSVEIGEVESVDSLPSWAQKELRETRSEAARYRAANRELKEKLEGAKSLEDFEAAVSEAKQRGEELERELAFERVRWGVREEFPQIPSDVFAMVTGKDEAELREKAERIAAHFNGGTPGTPVRARGGGLEPQSPSSPFDVKEAVARIPRF